MRIRASSLVCVAGSAIIAALFVMSGCGGSDSRPEVTPEAGTGGSTQAATTATAPATGGASTTTTATGTGGGTSAGFPCKMGVPKAGEVQLAPGTNGTWGKAIGVVGGDFGYATEGQDKLTPDAATTPGVINLKGTIPVGSYRGYGLYLKDPEKCWDLTSLTSAATGGIKIQMGGELGGAKVKFQLQQNNDYPVDSANSKGICAGTWSDGTCKNNETAYLEPAATLTEVDIPWSTVSGGSPDGLNLADVVGIQLHIDCQGDAAADCVVDFNFGTITLY